MSVETIVSLVMLALFGVIMLFSVIRGFARGWKKSLLAFCWLLGLFVLLLILSGTITKAVANFGLGFLNLEIDGVKIKSFADLGTALLGSLNLQSTALAGEIIVAIPLMIANVLVFTVMFWLLRLLTWPIYAIVSAIVCKKDRKAKREWKDAGKPTKPVENGKVLPHKPKLKRGLGALMGVACGLLICFVTFMPIMGANGYVQKLSSVQISSALAEKITDTSNLSSANNLGGNVLLASEDKVSLLSTFIDDEISGYLSLYQDSMVGKIFKYTGLNKLGELTFNGLTNSKVGNERIYLNAEIENVIDLYSKAEVLLIEYNLLNANEETFKNYTQSDWNGIITTSRSILSKAFESKFVSVILNNYCGDLVKFAVDEHLQEKIDNEVDNKILQQICNTGVDYLVKIGDNHDTSKFLYTELDKLLQICETINNYNLLNPLINNNYSKVYEGGQELIGDLVKDFKEFVDDLNLRDSSHYAKGNYINSLSDNLAKKLTQCSILSDLLPEVEESFVRALYKEQLGVTEYNLAYTQEYLNGTASFNINSAISRFKQMNTNVLAGLFKIVLNAGYNYDQINDFVTIVEADSEDKIKDIVTYIEGSDYLKNLLKDIGGLVDTVTASQAIKQEVEDKLIDKVLEIAQDGIKDSFNYSTLQETDLNRKLCDTILEIITNAGTQVKTSKCSNLMSTITTTVLNAYNAVEDIKQFTDISSIENPEDINIDNITKALDDLTGGDTPLITNQEIANVIEGAIDSIDTSNIENFILDQKIDENDENSKTVAETIINNIANNDINWQSEGTLVKDIAQKAIELTNNESSNTTTLVNDIKGLLSGLGTKGEDDKFETSQSQILTPELLNYFEVYLNTNFPSSAG